jgi:hypothetical protein
VHRVTPAPTPLLGSPNVVEMERENKKSLQDLFEKDSHFKQDVAEQLCHGCVGVPGVCHAISLQNAQQKICVMPNLALWDQRFQLNSTQLCPKGFIS